MPRSAVDGQMRQKGAAFSLAPISSDGVLVEQEKASARATQAVRCVEIEGRGESPGASDRGARRTSTSTISHHGSWHGTLIFLPARWWSASGAPSESPPPPVDTMPLDRNHPTGTWVAGASDRSRICNTPGRRAILPGRENSSSRTYTATYQKNRDRERYGGWDCRTLWQRSMHTVEVENIELAMLYQGHSVFSRVIDRQLHRSDKAF